MLIYMISLIGGMVIAAIFSPNQVGGDGEHRGPTDPRCKSPTARHAHALPACHQVTLGADAAVYGILGVHLVDLFQSWQVGKAIVFQCNNVVLSGTAVRHRPPAFDPLAPGKLHSSCPSPGTSWASWAASPSFFFSSAQHRTLTIGATLVAMRLVRAQWGRMRVAHAWGRMRVAHACGACLGGGGLSLSI
jgi:hypothetical protein